MTPHLCQSIFTSNMQLIKFGLVWSGNENEAWWRRGSSSTFQTFKLSSQTSGGTYIFNRLTYSIGSSIILSSDSQQESEEVFPKGPLLWS